MLNFIDLEVSEDPVMRITAVFVCKQTEKQKDVTCTDIVIR